MTQQMICTLGIPGCGKSTWAIEFASRDPYMTIVERDNLRAQFHTTTGKLWDYKMTKAKEEAITIQQEDLIRDALADGESVIVSDTNLNEGTRNRMWDIAADFGLQVQFKTFDVPLHQAMKWNRNRPDHVPEAVLIRMERKMREYLGKYVQTPEVRHKELQTLPSCVLLDLDGTLASMAGIRGPFDWDKVGQDNVIRRIASYANFLYTDAEHSLIIFSGRDGSCREQTEIWLDKHDIFYDGLYIREEGSTINDSILKEQLFNEHILGKFSVDHVVDDRKQVCVMYESMNIPVINVGGFIADF